MSELPEDITFKRLAWHSRRGMLELDVLLVPFLNDVYRELSKEDQERYQRLLDCEDPDLFSWFMQHSVPADPDHAYMVNMILNRVQPD
ncbi:MAG: succinate dehydrogenase assembly factor 2 [Oleiphilus sp.]